MRTEGGRRSDGDLAGRGSLPTWVPESFGPWASASGETGAAYASEHSIVALDLSWLGGASSTLRDFTTPSSTIAE